MKNDNKNKRENWRRAIRLLERLLTRANRAQKLNENRRFKMGRICVEISDKLEKQLRFKTIERFGGKKGDLSKAVNEAIRTWVAKKE
jgi:hypothetical protein